MTFALEDPYQIVDIAHPYLFNYKMSTAIFKGLHTVHLCNVQSCSEVAFYHLNASSYFTGHQ